MRAHNFTYNPNGSPPQTPMSRPGRREPEQVLHVFASSLVGAPT